MPLIIRNHTCITSVENGKTTPFRLHPPLTPLPPPSPTLTLIHPRPHSQHVQLTNTIFLWPLTCHKLTRNTTQHPTPPKHVIASNRHIQLQLPIDNCIVVNHMEATHNTSSYHVLDNGNNTFLKVSNTLQCVTIYSHTIENWDSARYIVY